MNIILLDHIDKVGAKHDVVKVKDGYGRNYLIPQGLGIVANKPNLARLEGMKKVGSKKEAVIIAAFKEVAARVKITAKAGENGRLFGSVTAQNLSTALHAMGIEADKRIIEMPEEVKELGSYTAIIKFHPEVETSVKFDVENEGGNEVELDD